MTTCRTTAHLARSDLSKQFVADIRGRFRPIRGRVRHFAIEEDGFGLRESAETARLQDGGDGDELPEGWPDAPERIDEFRTGTAKADAFADWLREALRDGVLEPVQPGRETRLRVATGRQLEREVLDWDHWTATYLRAIFRAAWDTAGDSLRVRGGRTSSTDVPASGGVEALFNAGVRPELLREVYLQSYEGLKDIVDDAAEDEVRRTITEGVAAGINPRKIGAQLTTDIRKLQRQRAETHARTTMAHARTQSTLQRYQAAGESVVSHVEFDDSDDSRVCPFCRRLNGTEMTISEMQGTHVLWRGDIYRLAPPAHASGRCSPLPSVGADAPTDPLADRVPGTIVTTTANPHALSQ